MNKKEFAKSTLYTGAIIYTAISAAVLIISALLMGDSNAVTESGGKFINISTHLFILVFAFFASITSNICKIEKISDAAKIFIHAFGYIGGFLFFLVLPLKRGFSGSVKLTVIFAIGYIIVKTLISIITYDEKGGKEKKNAKNTSGKNSSKQKKTAPTSAKPTKATKKMKDEEYTSLFTPKSN